MVLGELKWLNFLFFRIYFKIMHTADKVNLVTIPTKYGSFKIAYSLKGLINLSFPPISKRMKSKQDFKPKNSLEKKIYRDINTYFSGKPLVFSYQLDLSGSTPFQAKVWKALQKIHYAQVVSYADIAQKINNPKSFRAVGNACRKNPLPIIIPCHRVIKKNKSLGNFSGGIEWKQRLLNLEKVFLTSI